MIRALMASVALFIAVPAMAMPAIRVILVGDSTQAHGSGYGDALCARFNADVTCVNAARGGRSSMSYRGDGLWDQVTAQLDDRAGFSATYVLIQFGHNDQPGKPGRSTDLATEFPANMARYVAEARAHGAIPVLITPLSRRQFTGFHLRGDLAPWAEATRRVAADTRTPLIDLYADSTAALEAMGPVAANTLAETAPPQAVLDTAASGTSVEAPKTEVVVAPGQEKPPVFDYTHLGPRGAELFSGMVARDLATAVPDLAVHLKP